MRRAAAILLLLAISLALLVVPERGGVRAQTLPKVRVISGPTEVSADVYYAYEMGFFRRAGLDVDLQQVRSGSVAAAAIAANQADIADSNLVSFAQARVRGLPFVAIAPGQNYDTSDPISVLATLPNASYRTAKDLNGTTVAVNSLGSVAELCVDAWVEKNGGDLTTIKIVEVTFAESVAALEQGRVAAATLSDPQLSAERSRIRVLSKCFDAIAPKFMISVWFSTSEWANKNPDLVRRFGLALNDANDWAERNMAPSQAVLEKWLKAKTNHVHHYHSKNIVAGFVQPLLDSAAKYKVIPHPLSASEFIWTAPR